MADIVKDFHMLTTQLKQHNTLLKLKTCLREYPYYVNETLLVTGDPSVYLQLLNWLFLEYKSGFTQRLLNNDSLSGLKDAQFLAVAYKIMRDLLGYVPKLTRAQFVKNGYAETKMNLVVELMLKIQQFQLDLDRTRKPTLTRTTTTSEHVDLVEPSFIQHFQSEPVPPLIQQQQKDYDSYEEQYEIDTIEPQQHIHSDTAEIQSIISSLVEKTEALTRMVTGFSDRIERMEEKIEKVLTLEVPVTTQEPLEVPVTTNQVPLQVPVTTTPATTINGNDTPYDFIQRLQSRIKVTAELISSLN
jgi:hypothetical protein